MTKAYAVPNLSKFLRRGLCPQTLCTFDIVMRPRQPPDPLDALPWRQARHPHHEADSQGPRHHQRPLRPRADIPNSHSHLPIVFVSQASIAEGSRELPDLVAWPGCLCPSQNIIHSERIPRTEATQPKTTVPISLGLHRDPC